MRFIEEHASYILIGLALLVAFSVAWLYWIDVTTRQQREAAAHTAAAELASTFGTVQNHYCRGFSCLYTVTLTDRTVFLEVECPIFNVGDAASCRIEVVK